MVGVIVLFLFMAWWVYITPSDYWDLNKFEKQAISRHAAQIYASNPDLGREKCFELAEKWAVVAN